MGVGEGISVGAGTDASVGGCRTACLIVQPPVSRRRVGSGPCRGGGVNVGVGDEVTLALLLPVAFRGFLLVALLPVVLREVAAADLVLVLAFAWLLLPLDVPGEAFLGILFCSATCVCVQYQVGIKQLVLFCIIYAQICACVEYYTTGSLCVEISKCSSRLNICRMCQS